MRRPSRDASLRGALLFGAAALNVAFFLLNPRASFALLHPVAPPLTHIPAMGEKTLAPQEDAGPPPGAAPPGAPMPGPPGTGLRWAVERAVQATGTPDQHAALRQLHEADAAIPALARRAVGLRVDIESDAQAVATVVGAERVEAFLAHREDLSVTMGEAKVWTDAVEAVGR